MKNQINQFVEKTFPKFTTAYSGIEKKMYIVPRKQLMHKKVTKKALAECELEIQSALIKKFGYGVPFQF